MVLIMVVIIFIIALLFIVSQKTDFEISFGGSDVDKETITYLNDDNIVNEKVCILQFSDNNIEVGDSVTAKIQDGANSICNVYMNVNNAGWTSWEGNPVFLDANGLSSSVIDTSGGAVGTYLFRVICVDSNGNVQCVTPEKTVNLNAVSSDDDDSGPDFDNFCTDSDSGIIEETPGHTTTILGSMYDTCQDDYTLTEFYCNSGLSKSLLINCDYSCIQTRSGGYCIQDSPQDPDANPNEGIYCEASWPIPTNYEDCSVRTGCGDHSYCEYVSSGLANPDRCECAEEIGPLPLEVLSITHCSFDGCTDELPFVINYIHYITQGSTVYIPTIDYIAHSLYIDWSLWGNEPATGSSYEIYYYD